MCNSTADFQILDIREIMNEILMTIYLFFHDVSGIIIMDHSDNWITSFWVI